MTKIIEIFIPCEVFSVQVVSAPAEKLSNLEQFILRAIHAGADSLSALDVLFGLGERPILDIVFDLWQSNYLTVDLETGLITVPDQVVQAISAGALSGFTSSDREETTISLLYDLVGGSIMQILPAARGFSHDHCAPARYKEGSYRRRDSGRGRGELIRVVNGIWKATTQSGRQLRVLAANLTLPQKPSSAQEGEVRRVLMEISCEIDEVSSQLRVNLLSPTNLPARARSNIEAALATLVEDQPSRPFSKLLWQSAEVSARGLQVMNVEELAADLQDLVDRLDSVNPGTLSTWHENLLHQAEICDEAILTEIDAQVAVVPIIHEDEQVRMIQEAILTAQRQVVLGCPFLRYEAFRRYRNAITTALERGVRVFLIWGMDQTSSLDSGLLSLFDDFRSRSKNFSATDIPARCHAKFVVCDASSLIITSYNFLNREPGGVFELGLRITSHEPGAPCQAALDLLKHSSQIHPDYNIGALISTDAQELSRTLPNRSDHVNVLPNLPLIEIGDASPYARAAMALWRQEWHTHASVFADLLAHIEFPCSLVLDGRHRELLHHALRTATSFVVIMSDRLTADVVNQPFIDELATCLQRNALVVIAYQRPESTPLQKLRSLQISYPGLLELLSAASALQDGVGRSMLSHAKVLIADDRATVTSFNFLSFEGYYAGADRHRVRSEAGVTVRSWSLVTQLLRMMSTYFPALARLAADAEIRAAAARLNTEACAAKSRLRRSLQALLVDLVAMSDPESQGKKLVDWFKTAESDEAAFLELEALRDADLPYLRRAVASCLTARGSAEANPRFLRWYSWITESMWHDENDPYATLLLISGRSDMPPTEVLPPPSMLKLVILSRSSTFPIGLFEALLPIDADVDTTAALVGIGLPALLLNGAAVADSLDLLRLNLGPGLLAWTTAALAYWHATQGDTVPIYEIRSLMGLRDARDEATRLREELLGELAKTIHLSLPFKLGQLVWPRLVEGEDGYRALIRLVEQNDATAALAWLERHGRTAPIIESRLDELARTVAVENNLRDREITSKKRRLCLSRMLRVAEMTSAWIVVHRTDAKLSTMGAEVSELARAFARASDQVLEEASELKARQSFAYPIIDSAFASLRLLISWGEIL
jgi:phosphatidylserine/phosphatidylglycerophosphate/cardiolipin synthase-like enzyme